MCVAQSTPGGDGGPAYETRNDGTGGGVPAATMLMNETTIEEIISVVDVEIAAALRLVVSMEQAREAAVARMVTKVSPTDSAGGAEHNSNARKSTEQQHQQGKARKLRDRGGDKGDDTRGFPRRRPKGYKGPWLP
jgi:hypothetical protein